MATENPNLVMLATVVRSQQPINFAIKFFSVELNLSKKKKKCDEKGLEMQIKYQEMGIKIPFPATAEKSDVDTASFAQSFMKQAAFFFGMFVIFLATSCSMWDLSPLTRD